MAPGPRKTTVSCTNKSFHTWLVSAWCLLVCPRPPEVPLATTNTNKEAYRPGEDIVYECNPGYVPRSGSRRYTCPLSGVWPTITFRCIRKYVLSVVCLFFAFSTQINILASVLIKTYSVFSVCSIFYEMFLNFSNIMFESSRFPRLTPLLPLLSKIMRMGSYSWSKSVSMCQSFKGIFSADQYWKS